VRYERAIVRPLALDASQASHARRHGPRRVEGRTEWLDLSRQPVAGLTPLAACSGGVTGPRRASTLSSLDAVARSCLGRVLRPEDQLVAIDFPLMALA
jgi:hypothetical protein